MGRKKKVCSMWGVRNMEEKYKRRIVASSVVKGVTVAQYLISLYKDRHKKNGDREESEVVEED